MAKRAGNDRRLKWGDGWIDVRANAAGEPTFLARWREDDPKTGKRVVRAKTFRLQAEAEAHLRKVADRQATGSYVPPEKLTVAELVDQFRERAAHRWSPATIAAQRERAKALIARRIGDVRVSDLTAPRVQHWIDGLVRAGYAASTIGGAVSLLYGACKDAVVLGILPANPVSGTRRPAVRREPVAVWTADEVRAVLVHLKDDPFLNAAYRLALSTGIRPGELRAVRWGDVDLDDAILYVQRTMTRDADGHRVVGTTTKSKRRRAVALVPSTVAALRAWRTVQTEQRLAAKAWEDGDVVFTDDRGRVRTANFWDTTHAAIVAAAGVRRITPHGTRHTNATLDLEAGTHPKVVSERLGHTSVTFTLDRYSHVSVELQRAAAQALEDRLFGAPDTTTPESETRQT